MATKALEAAAVMEAHWAGVGVGRLRLGSEGGLGSCLCSLIARPTAILTVAKSDWTGTHTLAKTSCPAASHLDQALVDSRDAFGARIAQSVKAREAGARLTSRAESCQCAPPLDPL